MSNSPTRIRWTEVEKIALAQATHSYLRIYPDARLLKAFTAAQGVLPDNRKRQIQAKAEITWIDEYLEKVASAAPDENLFAAAATAAFNHEHEPSNVLHLHPPAKQAQAPLPLEAPPPQKLDLDSIPLEELTKVWLNRFFNEHIAPQIDQRADEMIAKKMATMIEQIQVERGEKGRVQIVVPQQIKKAMKPKVLILGLLGAQITTIKQQFGDALDLTLVGSDHNHNGLISLAKSHDLGLVMTRFINHSQQDQVRNNCPHTIFVSGSTTDLGNILHSIVKEGPDKAKEHNFANKTFSN